MSDNDKNRTLRQQLQHRTYIRDQSKWLLAGNKEWRVASLWLTSLLYELVQEAGFACSSIPNHQEFKQEIWSGNTEIYSIYTTQFLPTVKAIVMVFTRTRPIYSNSMYCQGIFSTVKSSSRHIYGSNSLLHMFNSMCLCWIKNSVIHVILLDFIILKYWYQYCPQKS